MRATYTPRAPRWQPAGRVAQLRTICEKRTSLPRRYIMRQ
ncbi:MAG: hypothetical protein OJF49_003461 [Ktedonobacterales bacterium]|nr:MAG: hypothetical protein OJF49_003461 [Ktedonobacterales bacterium]